MLRTKTFGGFAVAFVLTLGGACNDERGEKEETVEPAPKAADQPQDEEQATPTRTTPARPGGPMMSHRFGAGCPMAIEGVEVDVSDAEGGVAMEFTTDTGDVQDLRDRVRHMAAMYEIHRGGGHMMWHHHMDGHRHGRRGHGRGMGPGRGMGGQRTPMPDATATMEEIDEGARLVLVPRDPAELDELRTHAQMQEQRMESGQCWRLQQREEERAPEAVGGA